MKRDNYMKNGIIAFILALMLALTSCQFGGGGGTTDPNGGQNNGTQGGSQSGEHVDVDDNGICDDCSISVVEIIDFYAINDLHGKACDGEGHPGVDELTTYLKGAYSTDDHVVLLSSGDMWQGSSESNFTKGLFITEWMNELDFVSMTLGNHEYDWGEEFIRDNLDIAEFPFLAINVYERATNELADYCRPSVMIERGGVQIGIIGAIGDCYGDIAPERVSDVYFKVGMALTDLVKAEATRLREAGADFIVYSIHDGYGSSRGGTSYVSSAQISSYYSSVLSDGYVDLVFEGHTHQSYVLVDQHGVYHLQNGGDNDGISHVEVKVNFANGNDTVTAASFVSTDVYDSLEEDPIIDDLMDKYYDQIAGAFEVVGKNDAYRNSEAIKNIVAELYYKTGIEAWGEEYDIVLGGGFMSVRSPYNLESGDVTYGDLYSLLPFDNSLVLCSIKGSDLKSKFFESTSSKYAIYYESYGADVKKNIDPNATYYVVVDTYTSSYAPNRLTVVERYEDPEYYARDMLADFIGDGGLSINLDNISLTPIPEILSIGSNLADNAMTSTQYFVKGKITSIEGGYYGNMTITSEDGITLYIYGTYDVTGKIRYGDMTDRPEVGDTVTLVGPIKRFVYGNTVTVELMNARIVSVEE